MVDETVDVDGVEHVVNVVALDRAACCGDPNGMDAPTFDTAWQRLEALYPTPLREWLDAADLARVERDKGAVGRVLERALGVRPGGGEDFIDGELKSYHADPDGYARETICLMQVADVDALLGCPPWDDAPLARRVRRLLLVGIDRSGPDPGAWQITSALRIDGERHAARSGDLAASYRVVVGKLLDQLRDHGCFRTVGDERLQLRVKDARPYRRLYSARLGAVVSDKQIGFYLTRPCVDAWVDEARAAADAAGRWDPWQ